MTLKFRRHISVVALVLVLLWVFRFKVGLVIATHTNLGPIFGLDHFSRVGMKVWKLGAIYLAGTVAIGAAGRHLSPTRAIEWEDRAFRAAWMPASACLVMLVVLEVVDRQVRLASLVGGLIGVALCALVSPAAASRK